jgi:hypothetical protein
MDGDGRDGDWRVGNARGYRRDRRDREGEEECTSRKCGTAVGELSPSGNTRHCHIIDVDVRHPSGLQSPQSPISISMRRYNGS